MLGCTSDLFDGLKCRERDQIPLSDLGFNKLYRSPGAVAYRYRTTCRWHIKDGNVPMRRSPALTPSILFLGDELLTSPRNAQKHSVRARAAFRSFALGAGGFLSKQAVSARQRKSFVLFDYGPGLAQRHAKNKVCHILLRHSRRSHDDRLVGRGHAERDSVVGVGPARV